MERTHRQKLGRFYCEKRPNFASEKGGQAWNKTKREAPVRRQVDCEKVGRIVLSPKRKA